MTAFSCIINNTQKCCNLSAKRWVITQLNLKQISRFLVKQQHQNAQRGHQEIHKISFLITIIFLSQIFIVKCFTKSLLIRILKRDTQVHFFRRLEKCTKRLVKCEGSIEFLRLCINFDVVPTFAQVERRKARKWRKSADNYQREVLVEELRSKQSHLLHLKGLVHKEHEALREECSTLRYVAATHVLSASRNALYRLDAYPL